MFGLRLCILGVTLIDVAISTDDGECEPGEVLDLDSLRSYAGFFQPAESSAEDDDD